MLAEVIYVFIKSNLQHTASLNL